MFNKITYLFTYLLSCRALHDKCKGWSRRKDASPDTCYRGLLLVITTIRLRFDCSSTALRPFDDLSKQVVREAATICPRPAPCKLAFDLLTLKVVSASRMTWATSVPILLFLRLSVLDLCPTYATDRRQTSIIA